MCPLELFDHTGPLFPNLTHIMEVERKVDLSTTWLYPSSHTMPYDCDKEHKRSMLIFPFLTLHH